MNKGQIGTVFKLIISAAFAVALLGIIYSYTSSISPPITGINAAESVLESASNAPDKCFSRDPVRFREGQIYEPRILETHTGGISVTIENELKGIYDESSNEITQNVESSVSATCSTVQCELWIGSSTCGK